MGRRLRARPLLRASSVLEHPRSVLAALHGRTEQASQGDKRLWATNLGSSGALPGQASVARARVVKL